MITSLVNKRKLSRNSQPRRVLTLLVVGIFLIAGTHALSKPKGPVTIDPPDSLWSQAYAISNRGDVVGRVIREDGSHGFVFSKGEFTTIDIPESTFTEADGINSSGAVVGRYFTEGVHHGYLLEVRCRDRNHIPGSILYLANRNQRSG